MAYFAPIHRPTSVRHSLTARFTSETEDDLIIAITNRLEVWRVTYDGAVFLHSRAINGTISALSKLRPKDARRDMLFIGTDMNSYITVWWDDATKQIETPEVIQENFPDFVRASESTDRALVDEDGKFIAMLLWEGVISISRMEDRPKARKGPKSLRFLGQSRISELYVKSACFLPSITGPRIAFLHQKQHDWEEAQISIYPITSDDKHTEPSDFSPKVREHMFTPKDHLTSILIPIPSEFDENNRYHVRRATAAASRAYLGGLVAVGETTVIYMDGLNFEQVQAFLPEATLFTTWVQVDNRTYILGDDYGYLHVLRLVTEGTWVTSIEVAKFNQQISRASTLSYLGNGLLYLGSHYADSQLLRLDFNKLELEVLTAPNSFANNAPILDFALMDMGIRGRENAHRPDFSTGQARIVAGSGIWSDGSLRSIRSGVGADIVGVLDDFKDVSKMFALRFEGAEKVNMVAVSSLTDTRVFEFGIDGSIEELDFLPFLDFSQSSLVIRDVRGNQVLQVTASSATLRHKSSGKITKSWSPGGDSLISNASANDSYALIVVDGTKLISLDLNNQLAVAAKEAEPSSDGIEDEVTCISTSHSFPSIGIVALWKSGTISLVNLTTMRISATFTIPKSEDSIAVPRDAALVQIHKENEGNPSLIVAMDDGMVVVFSISLADYSVSSMITVVLGSREGKLYVLPREEDRINRVLVASDLPSLIYSETPSKYIFSATTFEDVTSIVSFDSDAFPGSLIIAANGQLLIGTIDDQRRTHVKTLPLKKTVRRLAYLPSQQAFILACLSKKLVNNEEVVESSLQLVDEIMFRPLGDPLLLEHKSHSQIPESLDILEFYDSIDGKVERLVVGTSYIESGSIETEASGTLTVFGIDEKKNVFPLVTWQTPSAISSVKVKDNLIFVGVVSGIRVFKYTETSPTTGHLEKVASKSSILSPTSLDVCDDIVGVSDLTKSAFFFRFNAENSEAFELIGQHRFNLWPTALACVAPHTWLQADSQGNVIVFNIEKQEKQKNVAERLALPTVEYISAVNIGEQVNTLRPLDITPEAGKLLGSQAIMTTAEGGVYLFGILAPEYRDALIHLQERITQHIKTLGDLSFAEYRAFRDAIYAEKEPQSFVVGEQLERFLEMSETMQEVVCEGLPISVSNARNVIRRLKYMH